MKRRGGRTQENVLGGLDEARLGEGGRVQDFTRVLRGRTDDNVAVDAEISVKAFVKRGAPPQKTAYAQRDEHVEDAAGRKTASQFGASARTQKSTHETAASGVAQAEWPMARSATSEA